MTERDDQSIDNELSGVAMAALMEHESTVSANETEAALEAVRSRIAGGDLGGAPPSIPLTRTTGGRRSPWVRFGAVAAAVSMVALGLVAVVGGGDSTDIVTPGTVPQTLDPDPSVSTPPLETAPTTVSTTTSTSPTVAASPTFERQVIAVDALAPPVLVEPVPFISVSLAPNPSGSPIEFAVGSDHVVVNQPGTGSVTIVGQNVEGVTAQEVAIDEDVSSIVSGPGPVIYGLGDAVFDEDNQVAPRGFRFVAIPFLGDGAGRVIAVDEVGLNEYLEIPQNFFGHGPDGIVARGRDRATVIGYVDENGDPRDSGESAENGTTFPVFGAGTDDQDAGAVDEDIVTLAGTDVSWELDIARDPAWVPTFVGRNVVMPGLDRAVYFERIGADTDPDSDFGQATTPVVALLNYDGSGRWVRLPEDWDVVASDVWGTLLARVTEDEVELARLDDLVRSTGPAAPVAVGIEPTEPNPSTTAVDTATTTTSIGSEPGNGLVQPTAIEYNCQTDVGCTELAATQSGRIVAIDTTGPTLRVYDSTGTELQSEIDITEAIDQSPSQPFLVAFLVAIGPDDVAYVQTYPTEFPDGGAELLAIPLVGSNAGSVVMRWAVDGTGDSSLIPRKTGLTIVGCCGPRVTRPEPDATIIRWVDRNGDVIESTAPSFDLNLGEAGSSLTRIDTAANGDPVFTRFPLPTAYQYPRDFPRVIATDDGGALARDTVQLQSGAYEVIVDFSPVPAGEGLQNGDVYFRNPADLSFNGLLERSGTVLIAVPDEGGFARRTLDEIATPGWPGEFETDGTDRGDGLGSTLAPGLNGHIDAEQPFWAADPALFALQLKAGIGPNERVEIVFDEGDAPTITITTSGFLDDSVEGSQRVITTELADDGLLRFVSGSYGVRCQPGRGHQDYSLELCV